MTFKVLTPSVGDVVMISSGEWYVWTGEQWREMSIDEQESLS